MENKKVAFPEQAGRQVAYPLDSLAEFFISRLEV